MTGRQSQTAFHLGSAPDAAGLIPIHDRGLRPALAAGYRDLSTLRYDFPVVLLEAPREGDIIRPLSSVVDDVLRDIADGDDAARLSSHVLELERHLRAAVSHGERGRLSVLWDATATRLAARSASWQDSLRRARAALTVDGELVECGAGLADRLLRHGWEMAQRDKGSRFRAHAGRLAQQLSEVLRGAFSHSAGGRTAASLRASIGGPLQAAFDFEAMATMLADATPASTLSDARRRRLHALVAALNTQQFHPLAGESGLPFAFESCSAALRAYRDRLPRLLDLVRALGAAELEAAGQYSEARHDTFFEQLGAGGIPIDTRDLTLFPDYFVQLPAAALTAVEYAALLEILDSRLPVKVVVEIDDALPAVLAQGEGRGRARQLGSLAAGLGTAFVLQAPASHLVQVRQQMSRGLAFDGPALFAVLAGVSPSPGSLPPYLAGALALESRVFPAFTFEPHAGPGGGRLDLSANPQPAADWPVYSLEYEGERHARGVEPIALTPADLLACDRRHARHFAGVPRQEWTDEMMPLSQWLSLGAAGRRAAVPFVLMVDADQRLQRVVVDAAVVRHTEDSLEHWRSLRHRAGAGTGAEPVEPAAPAAAADLPPADEPAPAEAPVAAIVAAPEGRAPGEAYIETPRCSTCNECIQINNRMFKYDDNRQAYLADPEAGTFRELVEAAESCQVSIIHPGAPRRPDEPGLDALLERAALFQ